MGAAPISAPVIGGVLEARLPGPSIHIATALIGACVLIAVLVRLPETLRADAPRPDASRLLHNYLVLLRSRPFLGYTFLYGFIQGSFFCFLAVGAAYFLDAYGIESQVFGVVWGLMAVAYVIGAIAGARLTERVGSAGLLRTSVGLSVIAAASLVLFTGSEPVPIGALLAPIFLLMMFSGTTTPGAMAGAIRPHPEMAGTASGLSSAIGLVLSGSFTVIAGLLYADRFQTVAVLMLVATVLAAGGWLLAVRAPRRAPGTG